MIFFATSRFLHSKSSVVRSDPGGKVWTWAHYPTLLLAWQLGKEGKPLQTSNTKGEKFCTVNATNRSQVYKAMQLANEGDNHHWQNKNKNLEVHLRPRPSWFLLLSPAKITSLFASLEPVGQCCGAARSQNFWPEPELELVYWSFGSSSRLRVRVK